MRLRLAPVLLAVMAILALAVTGCGDKSPAEQAKEAAAERVQNAQSPTAQTAKSNKEAQEQLESALKEERANVKQKDSIASEIGSPKQIRAFEKIRKTCIASAKKKKQYMTSGDYAGEISICNDDFKNAVIAAKRQAKQLVGAYDRCLKEARAETNSTKREKMMIGCASIPH